MDRIGLKVQNILLLLSILLILTGCSTNIQEIDSENSSSNESKIEQSDDNLSHLPTEEQNQTVNLEVPIDGKLEVHFIDVGQADAILIKGPKNQNIMIDAGNNADSDMVVDYINKQNVSKFKAVIGTHPHEDHIGGLDAVINNFEIEKVYMPNVAHTTKTFEDVLDAINSKGLKISNPIKGSSIAIEGLSAVFLGPVGSDYEDLNNYSVVLKLKFGNNSFLFQGDAEDISEKEILMSDMASELKADVLKVGHHGSHSSTTPEYLAKVNPKYAVVMVAEDNDYGHPHREIMDRLKENKATVYRTDQKGTIVATSNGNTITFNTEPNAYPYGSDTEETKQNNESSLGIQKSANHSDEKQFVDANGNGLIKGNISSKKEKIYHMPGEAYYDKTDPEIWFKTEEEARSAGFRRSQR